jgi:hypothetical protein
MRNEAKYMRKRPTCLTKDDMDLRVTICHILERRFRTGAHIFQRDRSIDGSTVNIAIERANAKLTSLLMHCFHCILTNLFSQALLQAVLDKEPRDFIGSVIQYEFSKLPAIKGHCAATTGAIAATRGGNRAKETSRLTQDQAYQVG